MTKNYSKLQHLFWKLVIIISPLLLCLILFILSEWTYYVGFGVDFKITSQSPQKDALVEIINDRYPGWLPVITPDKIRINLYRFEHQERKKSLIYLQDESDVVIPEDTQIIWSKDGSHFLLISSYPKRLRGFTPGGEAMAYLTKETYFKLNYQEDWEKKYPKLLLMYNIKSQEMRNNMSNSRTHPQGYKNKPLYRTDLYNIEWADDNINRFLIEDQAKQK